MKLSKILAHCSSYSMSQFNKEFILVTEDTAAAVNTLFNYNDPSTFIGMWYHVGEFSLYPQDKLPEMFTPEELECITFLREQPENSIDPDVDEMEIAWGAGEGGSGAMRIYPHNFWEYFDYGGEGNVQLSKEDLIHLHNIGILTNPRDKGVTAMGAFK